MSSNVTSLNTLAIGTDGATPEYIELLASNDPACDPLREAGKSEARHRFRRAFATLGIREREVAVLLYSRTSRCAMSRSAARRRHPVRPVTRGCRDLTAKDVR